MRFAKISQNVGSCYMMCCVERSLYVNLRHSACNLWLGDGRVSCPMCMFELRSEAMVVFFSSKLCYFAQSGKLKEWHLHKERRRQAPKPEMQ